MGDKEIKYKKYLIELLFFDTTSMTDKKILTFEEFIKSDNNTEDIDEAE